MAVTRTAMGVPISVLPTLTLMEARNVDLPRISA